MWRIRSPTCVDGWAGMAEIAEAGGRRICLSSELVERGLAVLFDVVHYRERMRAFALRFDGRVVAYLNRCAHVPVEMDWQSGRFLDSGGDFIICSIHGATYAPRSGRCVGGPCGRGALVALRVEELDGHVCWYPSRDIRAVDAAAGAAVRPAPESTP